MKPLEQAAARQTFIDIADNRHNPNEVDKVLPYAQKDPAARPMPSIYLFK
jgi:hypothetical protein